MEENILLVGFMGSGKSVVGKRLSKILNRDFIDTDTEIEKEEKRSIKDIFYNDGEDYFRNLESKLLETLVDKNNCIISTGGGIVLRENNRELLKKIGKVIFLHADVEHILNNVKNDDTRPLLQTEDYATKISKMLESREDKYLSSADIIIQTSGKDVESIAEEIITLL
ncbi:shikimate kinase [Vallitalea sp.]|jgi:shikimate dehydrogenase|uniref:shikimate kinase n=1 Tax=Vallitalea sp. TaxID=1882829 RepID=UPI0025E6A00D|nr:shikimate kinase [Vallitalea sp.]MCT4687083.1 shikimate kinase [Vallitalea sp.]